mmetsp:Transcript_24942/g.45101  ORF Transcript_24942/g.45101 Transcript_24942/m.45101 type:complete len:622 (-) Transcript_24942:187-2052(-)
MPGAPALPGARSERSTDMSHAERVKFGSNASGGNGGPGAKMATELDVSNAERMKFGSGPSSSNIGSRSATANEMSNAERVKFGSSGVAPMPGVQEATPDEMAAAARLKFGEHPQALPGAHDGDEIDSRAAEALKFGSIVPEAPYHEDEPESSDAFESSDPRSMRSSNGRSFGSLGMRSVRSSDDSENFSQNYLEEDEEDGAEIQNDDTDGSYEYDSRGQVPKYDEEYDDEGYEMATEPTGTDPYTSPYESEPEHQVSEDRDRKATEDGWRSLCILCTCLSCITVIGLSIGLGLRRSADGDSTEELDPVVIFKTRPPSESPTVAPTKPAEDFKWCYGLAESASLRDTRYASLWSVLTGSGISTEEEFSDDTSYQRKSLCWLAFGDKLQLDATDPFLEQRYAMGTIYYSFGEPESLLSQGWLSGKPECEWRPMVECDSRTDTIVSRMSLRDNILIGGLPKEVSVLKDVTHFDLSNNQLVRDVSATIGGWVHLTELRLDNNNFESFPSSLNDWTALKHLDISSNDIKGPISENLTLASQLVFLDFADNEITGTISRAFGTMSSLETFYMHTNFLDGPMPDAVCNLRSGSGVGGGKLSHLTADSNVKCNCCTECDGYDVDKIPWD